MTRRVHWDIPEHIWYRLAEVAETNRMKTGDLIKRCITVIAVTGELPALATKREPEVTTKLTEPQTVVVRRYIANGLSNDDIIKACAAYGFLPTREQIRHIKRKAL